MKNKLATALMTAGLTGVLALIAVPSMAEQGSREGMSHGMDQKDHPSHQESRMEGRRGERMAQRIAQIKSALNLTSAQEGAWNSFETAMKPPMRKDAQTRQEHQKTFQSMTTPQRLDWMESMKAKREGEMGQRTQAIKAFYQQLSAEQQKAFDQVFWSHQGRRDHDHQAGNGHDDQGRMHQGQNRMK